MGEGRRTYHWGGDQPTNQRLTVAQAADQLGITEGAVRSRIKRGTLATERVGGRVYVLVGPDEPTDRPGESSALISQMQAEIEYLREESRRKDHIIAGLVERIPPQLEAPADTAPEPPGSPETATEQPGREPQPSVEGAQEPSEPRSWWRRMFEG